MRADDRRAFLSGDQVSGERSAEPLSGFGTHDRIDEALARGADQKRQIEAAPSVKPGDAGEALLGRLAEADPRVKHDLIAADACLPRDLERAREEFRHLGDDVDRWIGLV